VTSSVLTSAVSSMVSANDIDYAALFRRGFEASTTSINIGGLQPDALIAEIEKVGSLSGLARSMMLKKDSFRPLGRPEKVTLIWFQINQGMGDHSRIGDLLNLELLDAWSKERLDGYVIRPCRAEVAPHLVIQGEVHRKCLWVVHGPIETMLNERVFGVRRSCLTGKPRLCDGATVGENSSNWLKEFPWSPRCYVVYELVKL